MAAATACVGDPAAGDSERLSDAELAACLVDVWNPGPAQGCDCTETAPQPECGVSDCEAQQFMWFRADRASVEGTVFLSSSLSTFSSRGPMIVSRYVIENGMLAVDPENRQAKELSSCAADEFVWGLVIWTRAGPGVANAFDAASPDLAPWTGEPFPTN